MIIYFNWIYFSGAHSGVDTHVPFPNTVVKDSSGDGTVTWTMGEEHGAGNFSYGLIIRTDQTVFFYQFEENKHLSRLLLNRCTYD